MALNQNKLMNVFGINEELENTSEEEKKTYEVEIPEEEIDDNYDGPSAPVIRNTNASPLTGRDLDIDIDYTIRTQNDLINQSQRAVQIALDNAQNGGTARDIEVLGETINTATNTVEKLIDLHTKIQKLKSTQGDTIQQSGNTYVQNQVVFQGTTADALRTLRNGNSM